MPLKSTNRIITYGKISKDELLNNKYKIVTYLITIRVVQGVQKEHR